MATALRENAITLVAQSLAEDFNVTTTTTLFTVPTGKEFTPFAVSISQCSADLASSTITIGQSGALTDFLNTQTLSGLNAAQAAGWLMPVPNATTVKIVTYQAGDVVQMDHVAAAGGAATADVKLWGFLNDA